MAEERIITEEGLQKYEDELNDLKIRQRAEVAQKIKEAREQGDLSENAEYDAAKDEQRDIEERIAEIESILKNVKVVGKTDMLKGLVSIGSTVKIHDNDNNEDLKYTIVGATEADSLENKISNESPLGKALLNHKKGDEVEVEINGKTFTYNILKIEQK